MKTALLTLLLFALLPACRAGESGDTPAGPSYAIDGEVENTGLMLLDPDLTVFEAVLRAKPVVATADLTRVRLSRSKPDPMVVYVDVETMALSGDSTFNVQVLDGDEILVPARAAE